MSAGAAIGCYFACGFLYIILSALTTPDDQVEEEYESMEKHSTGFIVLAASIGLLLVLPVWPIWWAGNLIDEIRKDK